MHCLNYSYCNSVVKITQVMLVLAIDILHSINDEEDIIFLLTPPSILVFVCAIFILIQKRSNYNLPISSLLCGLIILIALRILDKERSRYFYSTSIIYCLFNDNTILLHKESFVFISISAFLTYFDDLHDNKQWSFLVLIITSDSLSYQFVCNGILMKLDELISYQSSKLDYRFQQYFQFVSQDHKSIINIIAVTDNNQIYYVVYYQEVPKLDDNLTSLLDITSSISHELSSHLNCIITLSQLYNDNPNLLENNPKDNFLEPILANSQQLELIINNLKDYNNIQLDNFQSQIQKFDIVFEIFEICDYFKMIIQEKKLQIDFKFGLDTHFIDSDRQRFRQIFYQLMQNAIKFTYKSTIQVHLCNEQTLIKIQVIDSGQGMDVNEQNNLKEIFKLKKLARVSKRSVGCSLGLHISNLLAKKIGDNKSIHFESIINKGSIFTFWIKSFEQQKAYKSNSTLKKISVEQYQDSQLENLIEAQSLMNDYYSNTRLQVQEKEDLKYRSFDENISLNHSDDGIMIASTPPVLQIKDLQPNSQKLKINQIKIEDCCVKILIVDDEYFNIFALQAFLKQQNQRNEYAFDGQEAIDKIQNKLDNPCKQCGSNSYKLVFLDINMPIKDGIQTVKEIKQIVSTKNLQHICCAANSAFSDIETKQRAYEAGMDFCLTKPLNLPILKQLINKVFIGNPC